MSVHDVTIELSNKSMTTPETSTPTSGNDSSRLPSDEATELIPADRAAQGEDTEEKALQASIQDNLRQCTKWQAAVNLTAFMAVPYSLPATVAKAGWQLGLGFLLYSSLITYETGLLIADICNEHKDINSFPGLSQQALYTAFLRSSGDRRAAEGWGRIGHTATVVLQFVTYYVAGIVELIYFEQYMMQLFPSIPLCQWQWLLIISAACLPFMQIPTYKDSNLAARVTLGCQVVMLGVFVYEVAVARPWECPGTHYGPVTREGVAEGVAAFAYAFGGHGVYPEQIREMARSEEFKGAVQWCYGAVIPMYLLYGVLGFAAYGVDVHANLNSNFPDDVANRVSVAVQAVMEVYFVVTSALVLMLQVELALSVDPTLTWHPRRFGLPPVVFRAGFRTLFLASQVFIAEALLSGEGDTLITLQSLTGAVGMAAFTYFLPLLFAPILLPDRYSKRRRAWFYLNAAAGVVMMLVGLWFSVRDLVSSSGGFMDGSCRLDFTYADPTDPHDICHTPT